MPAASPVAAAMEAARSADVLRVIAADAHDVALQATHHAEARGRASAVWTAGPPPAHSASRPRWTNEEWAAWRATVIDPDLHSSPPADAVGTGDAAPPPSGSGGAGTEGGAPPPSGSRSEERRGGEERW